MKRTSLSLFICWRKAYPHGSGKIISSVRDNGLEIFTRQKKVTVPTDITKEIADSAMELFRFHYNWRKPIRSLGVRASSLSPANTPWQISMFTDPEYRERQQRMDKAVDEIRRRFGFYSIQRGISMLDSTLKSLNAKEDNIVHPHGYMEFGNRTGVDYAI